MKTSIIFLLLFVLSIACNAQKLNGSWKGKITTPNGEFELEYTFKVNGDSLSGNITSPRGVRPFENGKVNGNEFSFDIDFNGQLITNTGVLDGDIIKLSSPRRPEPMVLTRVKEKSKIDGKWLGKVSSPQGDMELTFSFIVDGDKLTGKSASAMGEVDLTNGVVIGNDFSFDVDFQGMKISHKCKYLEDDSVEVNVDVMDQAMVYKLTRAAQ
jgi:signal peptidase I